MKKIFLKLTDSKSRYWMFEGAQTKNFLLGNLVWFLEAWGHHDKNEIYSSNGLSWEWLHLDKLEEEKKVFLWSGSSLKNQAKKEGLNKQGKEDFDAAYDDYVERRREDIPKLYMAIENYVEIVQKWQKIVLEQRPQFIVLSQDDALYVDLVGKDELSAQDLADIKREHEKFLKYQAAYAQYTKSRPDIVDELWHGPESSEYESDWQKFLDEPLD